MVLVEGGFELLHFVGLQQYNNNTMSTVTGAPVALVQTVGSSPGSSYRRAALAST